MGKWCEYDLLSGSDGGLRLALEFINAAAPDQYCSWDDDVQLYSELSPPDDDRSRGGPLRRPWHRSVHGRVWPAYRLHHADHGGHLPEDLQADRRHPGRRLVEPDWVHARHAVPQLAR